MATYLLALVVFLALGYSLPFTMALVAGLLRLVPLLTPWLLVGGLSVYHLGAEQVGLATSVGIAGGGLIAAFPYRVLHPWLFPDTAPLSPMLYVPGFFGGLLTMEVAGIFVGPVVLVALSEVVTLLAREIKGIRL